MATIDRRPTGKWRAQVRREGFELSKTFIMKGDAEAGSVKQSGAYKGEDPTGKRSAVAGTFGSLIELHIDDLAEYGKHLRRSKDSALTWLQRELGH
jgi:hypothetical protein